MKTPAEFEPIAVWMGWTKIFSWSTDGDWLDEDNQYRGVVATKTSLTNAEAVEAMRRLTEKGYYPEMYYSVDSEGFAAWYFTENPCDRALYYIGETFSQAVEQCLKHLASAEGGEE